MGQRLIFTFLFLLWGCGKPEQFPRIAEDPARAIHTDNCMRLPCVAIISHSTLDAKYLDLTIDNHLRYANKSSYDYIFRNNLISTRFLDEYSGNRVRQLGLYWQKIAALTDAMEERVNDRRRYTWVMWVDADAVFTNFDLRIEDILARHGVENFDKPNIYFLASKEPFHLINAGVLVFYNNEWSRNMLRVITDAFPLYSSQSLPEQDAMQDYIAGFLAESASHEFQITPMLERDYNSPHLIAPEARVLDQRVLNSFYGGWFPWASSEKEVWEPSDFIAHFAVVSDKNADIRQLIGCFKAKGGEHYENSNAYRECR